MPIKTLQRRLTQVGVIRLGEQRVSQRGKNYPVKLDTLRFTSPSQRLIDTVAAKYGGQARPWQSNAGPQFEVITEVREIPVLVPPQQIDPNFELWGNGFKSRHCDGEVERIRSKPCLCDSVRATAQAAGRDLKPGEVCKPTTRMSLMLADIPSLGTWKLESHGWNAAAELPMLAESIERAPQPIPARLLMERREKKLFHPTRPEKDQIESRVFMVPVLHFDFVTPAQAFGGQIAHAARQAMVAQHLAAIEAGSTAPDSENLTEAEVIRLAKLVDSVPSLQTLWKDAAKDGVLTEAAKKVLTDRAKELPDPAQRDAEPTVPTVAATGSAGEPVDAEIVDEPNKDALWVQIQAAAGKRKWNADALKHRIIVRFNKASDEINGWEMEKFLADVESGAIS
ncbi:hypothetical protein ACIBCR_14790 [Micromonospora echinospora]|uniref:recombination directionality factor n=1 Tax=Micromonospora echinospora TaxID=1877 RepID=UPI0037BDCC07